MHQDSDKEVVFLKAVSPSESLNLHAEAPCQGDRQITLSSLHVDVLYEILSLP